MSPALPARLIISQRVFDILQHDVCDRSKEAESCGILGGQPGDTGQAVATYIRFLDNLSLLRTAFAVDVDEFRGACDALTGMGLAPLAFFHSHPGGSTRQSYRDSELPDLLELPSLIVAWDGVRLRAECYARHKSQTVTIPVEIAPRSG